MSLVTGCTGECLTVGCRVHTGLQCLPVSVVYILLWWPMVKLPVNVTSPNLSLGGTELTPGGLCETDPANPWLQPLFFCNSLVY